MVQLPHERRPAQPIGWRDAFFALRVTTEQNNNSALLSKTMSSVVCHVSNPASGHLSATDGRQHASVTAAERNSKTLPSAFKRVCTGRFFFVVVVIVAATCRHARSCSEPALCSAINLILPRRKALLTSHGQGETIWGSEKHCQNKIQTNAGIHIST